MSFGSSSQTFFEHQTGLGKPVAHLRIAEAQTHMRMVVAQELKFVRGEIDDQHSPSCAQCTCRLANCFRRIIKEMQDLVNGHEIEGFPINRQRIDVAMANLRIGNAVLVEV